MYTLLRCKSYIYVQQWNTYRYVYIYIYIYGSVITCTCVGLTIQRGKKMADYQGRSTIVFFFFFLADGYFFVSTGAGGRCCSSKSYWGHRRPEPNYRGRRWRPSWTVRGERERLWEADGNDDLFPFFCVCVCFFASIFLSRILEDFCSRFSTEVLSVLRRAMFRIRFFLLFVLVSGWSRVSAGLVGQRGPSVALALLSCFCYRSKN